MKIFCSCSFLFLFRVYANKCKLCQRFALLFQELARKQQERQQQQQQNHQRSSIPRFGKIQYGANRHLCKSLGIQSLPTVLIYSQGTLIDQFVCGRQKQQWPELMNKILYYQNLSSKERKELNMQLQ